MSDTRRNWVIDIDRTGHSANMVEDFVTDDGGVSIGTLESVEAVTSIPMTVGPYSGIAWIELSTHVTTRLRIKDPNGAVVKEALLENFNSRSSKDLVEGGDTYNIYVANEAETAQLFFNKSSNVPTVYNVRLESTDPFGTYGDSGWLNDEQIDSCWMLFAPSEPKIIGSQVLHVVANVHFVHKIDATNMTPHPEPGSSYGLGLRGGDKPYTFTGDESPLHLSDTGLLSGVIRHNGTRSIGIVVRNGNGFVAFELRIVCTGEKEKPPEKERFKLHNDFDLHTGGLQGSDGLHNGGLQGSDGLHNGGLTNGGLTNSGLSNSGLQGSGGLHNGGLGGNPPSSPPPKPPKPPSDEGGEIGRAHV